MSARISAHEALLPPESTPPLSERRFAITAASALTIAGAGIPVLRGHDIHPKLLIAAAAVLVVGLLRPALLRLPNALFFRFARVVHAVVSRLALGVVFYGTLTPIALFLRAFRRDTLRRKRDPQAASYWLPRDSHPSSMRNQF